MRETSWSAAVEANEKWRHLDAVQPPAQAAVHEPWRPLESGKSRQISMKFDFIPSN